MAQHIVHKIAPHADTVIVLKNPTIHFAPWQGSGSTEDIEKELALPTGVDVNKDLVKQSPEPESLSRGLTKKKKMMKGSSLKSKKRRSRVNEPDEIPESSGGNNSQNEFNAANVKFEFDLSKFVDPNEERVLLLSSKDKGKGKSTEITPANNLNDMNNSIFGGGPSVDKGKPAASYNLESEEFDDGVGHSNIEVTEEVAQIDNDIKAIKGEKEEIEGDDEEEGIHFHVCSGNLMTGSPLLCRSLKKYGSWGKQHKEGDALIRLSAEDWDEEAFLILLRILHLRSREVPHTVSLDMLAKFAILVDYYECDEAVELYTDMWIKDLTVKTPIPSTYCRDLMLWMWVSWVFKLPDSFQKTTSVAIKQCTDSVQNLGLPIPEKFTTKIDNKRYQAIEAAVSGIHNQLDQFRSSTYYCPRNSAYSFQCGCMLLGALTKGLESAKLLSPRPEVPFIGYNFDSLCSQLYEIQTPVWYCSSGGSYYGDRHECSLTTSINSIVDASTIHAKGLDLNEGDM